MRTLLGALLPLTLVACAPVVAGGPGDGDKAGTAAAGAELKMFGSAQVFDEFTAEQLTILGEPRCARARSIVAFGAESASADESITNVQEAGVDEGGIVKVHGDHLVVLRRGRLFTVRMNVETLEPIDFIDLSPEGQSRSWYDEMLIQGDRIVVVGYSYGERATELGIFNVSADGRLAHEETFFLRSNDYYSSRNYASRLVDGKLVFYMPFDMFRSRCDAVTPYYDFVLPAVRHAYRPAGQNDWNEIVDKSVIYRPIQQSGLPVLHTVVTCDIEGDLSCKARGIIGPRSRTFYVSPKAVTLWVSDYGSDSVAYRLPLGDDDAAGAVLVSGAPVDQFSFKERDGFLNVLVRAHTGGDWMWSPEVTAGGVGLVRIPVDSFGTTLHEVTEAGRFIELNKQMTHGNFQNRFVGDHVLYGVTNPYEARGNVLYAHDVERGDRVVDVPLSHSVERIEVLGDGALVVGATERDLQMSSLKLGEHPRVMDVFVKPDAAQSESRSHGFFFKPSGPGEGTLALPFMERISGPNPMRLREKAGMLYVGVRDHQLTSIGQLMADAGAATDDFCIASCTDWYGNARPIFYRGRTIALLGYEMVEGMIEGDRITEIGRTNFSSILPRR